jgi:hypothetical protein
MASAKVTLRVKDLQTKEVFKVDPTMNTVHFNTRDGVRVRVHPVTITTMVQRGERFDGHTLKGLRGLQLI